MRVYLFGRAGLQWADSDAGVKSVYESTVHESTHHVPRGYDPDSPIRVDLPTVARAYKFFKGICIKNPAYVGFFWAGKVKGLHDGHQEPRADAGRRFRPTSLKFSRAFAFCGRRSDPECQSLVRSASASLSVRRINAMPLSHATGRYSEPDIPSSDPSLCHSLASACLTQALRGALCLRGHQPFLTLCSVPCPQSRANASSSNSSLRRCFCCKALRHFHDFIGGIECLGRGAQPSNQRSDWKIQA